MSNNYFAFSTAPVAHTSSVPVTGVLGHPSGNNNSSSVNGMVDGMLSRRGAGSPGSMMSGGSGGGGGMVPYPNSSSQSRQQPQLPPQQRSHLISNNSNNPGATKYPPSSVPLSANGPSAGVNANITVGTGGPAVPAPRSAATLLAEATGAPPPPPAPSRGIPTTSNLNPPPPPMPTIATTATGATGGVMALRTSVNSQNLNMSISQTPSAGITTPISTVAGSVGAGGLALSAGGPVSPTAVDNTSAFVASLVSPSFKAFTTSAATMLSAQGAAAATAATQGSDSASAGGIRTDAEAGLLKTEHSGHGALPAAPATTAATTAAVGLRPFTHVEVQLTLPSRESCDKKDGEEGAARWDPTQEREDIEDELDLLGYIFASLDYSEDDRDSVASTIGSEEGQSYYFDIFYEKSMRVAAAKICKIIEEAKGSSNSLRLAFRGVALGILFGGKFKVLLHLPHREAFALRYSVLKEVLERLVRCYRNETTLDKLARYLTTMVSLQLMNAVGYVAIVDTFLQQEKMVLAALRLAAIGLLEVDEERGLREAMNGVPRIAHRLRELYVHNNHYEMDVTLITRLWKRSAPILYGGIPLDNSFDRGNCPVTCMSYFGVRDELITGYMNGSVVLWGGPSVAREKSQTNLFGLPRPVIRPRGVVPLPLDCVPIGMAGQRIDGQYLAIASMPYKSRKPYLPFCKDADSNSANGAIAADTAIESNANRAPGSRTPLAMHRRDASNGAGVGAIIVITCNENSIRWNKGEVIMRPAGVALTAITAFRNSIVAVGESIVHLATATTAAVTSPHRLSFVDVACGTVMRQIPKAHDDFITALNVLDGGSYVLLSGGRDAAVKVWDPRSREDSPVVNTALCTGVPTHNSTISAMCTTGYNIVSTAVDGSILVWDLRSMEAPQVRHELDYPIVDVALITGKRAVTATSRGIITLSLDTLEPLDMRYYSVGYSHVLSNSTGELVFTADCSGVSYAVAVNS